MLQLEDAELVSTTEYRALRMVAIVAQGLLSRYPFDTPEEMNPRWAALAVYLAALPDKKEMP